MNKFSFSSIFIFLMAFGFFSFYFSPTTMAQSKENWDKHYQRVDSFFERGLPESAKNYFDKHIKNAVPPTQKAEYLKMNMYELYMVLSNMESDTQIVRTALQKTKVEKDPVALAIWNSISAYILNQYYSANSYKILQRTAQNTLPEDFEEWSADQFYAQIANLYLQSLAPQSLLQDIQVSEYAKIFTASQNTENIRPSLYDILANRALSFFKVAEQSGLKPLKPKDMDDIRLLGTTDEFLNLDLAQIDNNKENQDFFAYQIFQNLIRFHKAKNQTEAWINADLERIKFAYNKLTAQGKKEAYYKALNALYQSQKNTAAAQMPWVFILQQYLTYSEGDFVNLGLKSLSIKEVLEKLEQVIHDYPDSDAAALASSLYNNAQVPALNFTIEEVIIPGQNAKALLSYKNVEKVYCTIYKYSAIDFSTIGLRYYSDPNEKLAKAKVFKTWAVDLLQGNDFKNHTTEILIEALPPGQYALVINTNENSDKAKAQSISLFQASNLCLIKIEDYKSKFEYVVLDRTQGSSVANAQVNIFEIKEGRTYNDYCLQKRHAVSSNKEGTFSLSVNKNSENIYYHIANESDTLCGSNYQYNYSNYDNEKFGTSSSMIFTDRAIYRPGQTVLLKGIVYIKEGRNQFKVNPNRDITVRLFDANGQQVAEKSVKTNEFGSYQTQFELPEGLLNGNFRVQDEFGSSSFSVEEYKRPQFYLEFDKVKETFRLGQDVKVPGKAMSYAGVGLSNATVKYAVVRTDYMPYRWCYYYRPYWSPEETTIANGTINTDAAGKFEIPFNLSINNKYRGDKTIFYNFKIKVDVTDINGETHTATTYLNAGPQPFVISLQIPANGNRRDLKDLKASVQNLNSEKMDLPINLAIYKLKNPGFFRARPWQKPELSLFSKTQYSQLFPYDEYDMESNPLTWKNAQLIQDWKNIYVNKEPLTVNQQLFQENGYYLVEAYAITAEGDTVKDKALFHLFDPQIGQQAEQALIITADTNIVEPSGKNNYYTASVFGQHQNILFYQGSFADTQRDMRKSGSFLRSVGEADRGGISTMAYIVNNNRVYQSSHFTLVPWSNKQLNVEWASHRDKLLPGSEETWTMTVKGKDKEKIAAEMVSVLYDASLDDLKPHAWPSFSSLYNSFNANFYWTANDFSHHNAYVSIPYKNKYNNSGIYKQYADLLLFNEANFFYRGYGYGAYPYTKKEMQTMDASPSPTLKSAPVSGNDGDAYLEETTAGAPAKDKKETESPGQGLVNNVSTGENQEGEKEVKVRSNFNETAFFYPQLNTDKEGNIQFKFTLPESLTTWKMMSFAHTKQMQYGFTTGKVIGQKDLMLQPNMPRFFRQNDEVVLSAKVSNLTEQAMQGEAWIEITDPATGKDLSSFFQIENQKATFLVEKGNAQEVHWKIAIPKDRFDPVKVSVKAKSGTFTDGEEHFIPVLTNRVFVTESMPLPVKGSKIANFSFDKLKQNTSSKLTSYAYTFEYSANPAWYAVQALPYLMEYPYDCTEQMFSKVYANALARKIVENNPAIKTTFKQWQEKDTTALMSNLQKNQELKSALLEQTPWVLEAKDEAESKKNIARLFDEKLVQRQINMWLRKIRQNQNNDGGWPWFNGMYSNEYITQYLLTGFGKLRKMEALDFSKNDMESSINQAMNYADRAFLEHFEDLKRYNSNWKNIEYVDYFVLNYMYMRSFYPERVLPKNVKIAFDFYYSVAVKHPADLPLLQKAQMAVIANRNKDRKTAEYLVQSLQETAMKNEEMGMYWKPLNSPFYWYEAPIFIQATIIEAFVEVGGRANEVDEMKTWLLKQKQTQRWNSTISTADACYALLSQGSNWLSAMPEVNVSLGSNQLKLTAENTEAGTGYFKKRYEAASIKPEMGNIQIEVNQPAEAKNRPSWGAVYWQYFEDMDKVSSHTSPLSMSKKLFVRKNTDKGEQLIEINATDKLKVGDRLTVRIVVRADRALEFVHLKDMRAGAFEPIDVLSGYHYQGGLSYYQTVGDAAVNFFFDRLDKGTFVLEYDMFVNAKGTYSNGISTIQCMYAPEFGGHTEGLRLNIE